MNSYTTILPALILCLGAGSQIAWGQGFSQYPTNPANRPAVSPYLNLLRGGSTGGVNYYDLVRPQIDFRSGILQNQQQIAANQQSISNIAAAPLTTGHPARYMTHWAYFMSNGIAPGTAAFRRPGAVAAPTAPSLPAQPAGMAGGGAKR
jgi:hypothetical protein